MLGDLSEFPLFIELLHYQPAGHLAEMATDVLRHYVDPSHELDTPHLVQRAKEWWQANESQDKARQPGRTTLAPRPPDHTDRRALCISGFTPAHTRWAVPAAAA
jgi:hypothetical protein